MIELSDCRRIDMVPVGPPVISNVKTTVSTNDHVSTIVGIDPKIVTVRMDSAPEIAIEGQTAVLGLELRHSQYIDSIRIAWVDFDDAEIHRTRIERVHSFPSFTAIIGTINAAVFMPLGTLHILYVWRLTEIGIRVWAIAGSTIACRKRHFNFFRIGAAYDRNLGFVPHFEFADGCYERFVVGNRLASQRLYDIAGLYASFLRRTIGSDVRHNDFAFLVLCRDTQPNSSQSSLSLPSSRPSS